MVPPSWVEVPATMTDWVDSLVAITADASPVEAIAAAHAAFERTHPFLDGGVDSESVLPTDGTQDEGCPESPSRQRKPG